MKRLISYLTLGVIIGPLPFQIKNGDIVDAIPVMADFNWLRTQVNTNVPGLIPTLPDNLASIATFCVATGTGNAIVLTPDPAIVSNAVGSSFRFKSAASNTGAVTVNVSGLGALPLTMATGAALTGGEISSGSIYDICCNATGSTYVLVNSSQGTGLQSWTPVLSFGGGSTGITYSTQRGGYLKFLDIIIYSMDIVLTSKGSSTGAAKVAGLPYTNSSGSSRISSGGPLGYVNNITIGDSWTAGVAAGTAIIGFDNLTSGSTSTNWTDSNFTNSSQVGVWGLYSTG